jgi:broad specificity phosphatase PhoE
MAFKDLYIIRHGQTDYNLRNRIQGRGIDAPLNGTGIMQADAAAQVIRGIAPGAIRSSSLLRARQTAVQIAKACGKDPDHDIESHRELDEMDFGVLEGISATGNDPRLASLLDQWRMGRGDAAADGGESPLQVFERAHPKVVEIMSAADRSPVTLVLHGRLIRILLSQWLGLGYQGMKDIHHHNAGIHYMRWHDGNARHIELVYMNRTDHLNHLADGHA